MKIELQKYTQRISLIIGILVALFAVCPAQSTDIDQPTVLTSNVVDGEGDGAAETFYYAFTALKGDVKVTLDAKTDNYSVIMDAALTTVDGKELLKLSAVANDTGKREVATKHFVRDTKVILRVRLPKDEHLKLLTYRIKLEGSVQVETPPAPTTVPPTTADGLAVTSVPAEIPAAAPAPNAAVDVAPTPEAAAAITSVKAKAKTKVKTEAKKLLKSILDN